MGVKILAALCWLILLCSCTPFLQSTEELLEPPRLNQRQTKVEEALSSVISPGSILYKYPQSGDFRSPFVFYDLNQDGRQEAIVFFTLRDDPENVRAKILRELPDSSWALAHDISGKGDQVEFIRFANLLSDGGECMIVGWQISRRGESGIGVYSFGEDRFNTEAEMNCQSYSIDDYLGDGLFQIAYIAQDIYGIYFLEVMGRTADGRFDSVGKIDLSGEINSILLMRRGILPDGKRAVYIDELRNDTIVATEIFLVTASGLVELVGENNFEQYATTFRASEVTSDDLRGDGTVCVPILTGLPGADAVSEMTPLPLIEYLRLGDDGFEVDSRAVINEDAGYRIFFPDRWMDNVTVSRRLESNEWRFYKLDAATGVTTTELLRIWVYSIRDYKDQFSEGYELLAEKGLFQYYCYIPKTAAEPLSPTLDEVRRMFALL